MMKKKLKKKTARRSELEEPEASSKQPASSPRVEIPVLTKCPACGHESLGRFTLEATTVLAQGYQGQRRQCPGCGKSYVIDIVVYSATVDRRDLAHPHVSWIGFFQDLIGEYGAAAAVLLLYEGFKAGGLGNVSPRQIGPKST